MAKLNDSNATPIHIRLPNKLLEELDERADREGYARAEFVRHLIRQELAR